MADSTTTPRTTPAFSSGRIILLVIGDAISFLLFAGLGRNTHGEATGLAALGQVALTALPFALAWFVIAAWQRAFRRDTTDTIWKMFTRTEVTWVIAYPAALYLRVLLAPDHQMPITFAIVILLANAVFLGLWRSAFAMVERLLGSKAAGA